MHELMRCTPGTTEPHLCRDPLGTEAELTPGPDDWNPYDETFSSYERRKAHGRREPTFDRGPELETGGHHGRDPAPALPIFDGLELELPHDGPRF